ncbi:MAG: hypothetical protein J7603_19665, partial [Pseudacidovorax sp.]|nr:hypothetical protein [Pseudacidovorax sp.]
RATRPAARRHVMLRDLATVLADLQQGLQVAAQRAGMQLTHAEMTLPVDTALTLQGGSCVLRADVVRSYADADWREQPARLGLTWVPMAPEDILPAEARHA